MAITPDSSQLLVLDAKANTITVFNPDDPSQSTPTALPSTGLLSPRYLAVTSTGEAFVGGSIPPVEFNIATKTFKLLTSNTAGILTQFVATPDGSHMAAVRQNDSSGTVAVWNRSSDNFRDQGFPSSCGISICLVWTDLAISPDGEIVAPLAGNLSLAVWG
jgi:hypothetical protein